MLAAGLFLLRPIIGYREDSFSHAALQLLAVLIFVTRDVLFLQLCRLTRMRGAVTKGILYLGLYYGTTIIVGTFVALTGPVAARVLWSLLTPAGAFLATGQFAGEPARTLWIAVCTGLALQLFAVAILMSAISVRLRHPAGTWATP
jgi:hypothetical protein